ncbi:hypothetical protein MNBD_GAMMA22-1644 [hydrothermal vent metagenome]|uniref:Outer membrane lipoprotein carrier protein LolA n=1 Tax=hydrothermal vent metagenome TaxID=652676 RepID=A0A3B1A4Y0_9ZZZZ
MKTGIVIKTNIKAITLTTVIFCLILLKPITSLASEFTLDALATIMAANNLTEIIHFTENKNLRFLNKPLILSGRFYFRSSDFLQKNIDQPFVKVYTLKNNTLTHTDKKLESEILTLKDHPLIYASMQAFYTTMSGKFQRFQSNTKIELSGTSEQWELVLTPQSEYTLRYIKNVILSGNHTFIERVVTNEINGDSSIIWMTK